MEKFVLDTNIFFNMEAGFCLGETTNQVMETLINYGDKLENKIQYYMPPTVVDEFLSFFEN